MPIILLGLGACSSTGGNAPSAVTVSADSPATSAPATSAAAPATSAPAAVPAGSESPASTPATGDGTVGATLDYTNSNGDSVTQTYSFGAPVAETQLTDVQQQADGCTPADDADSTNLVIPVTVTTTLNSSVGLNGMLVFTGTAFSGAPSTSASPVIETFLYQYSGGYSCNDEANDNNGGVTLDLTPGGSVQTNTWIILDGAISPNYPAGDPDAIGQTVFNPLVGFGGSASSGTITISGPAVCTGGQPSTHDGSTYTLRIGGAQFGWENCNSSYTYPH